MLRQQCASFPFSANLLLLLVQKLNCEVENTVAREFLLAFPETEYGASGLSAEVELYLACSANTSTNVSIYLQENTRGVFENFTLDRNQVGYKTISSDFRLSGSGLGNRSVIVRSEQNVSLIVFNTESSSMDAFLALPTDALGNEYYVVTWDGQSAQFVICAFDGYTRINITLPRSFSSTVEWKNNLFGNGEVINVELDPYKTLQLQADGDLSGTHIIADAKVAVLSGNKKISVVNGPSADHLVEMLIPVNKWGKYFLVVATPSRESHDVVKIISSENMTTVVITADTIEEKIISTAGDSVSVDLDIGTSMKIEADKCVMVTQFTPSRLNNKERSDPSMMLVVPVEQYDTKYVFSVYSTTLSSYVVVTVKDGEEWILFLDGFGMDFGGKQPVRDSGYVTFYNQIQEGAHVLENLSPDNSTFGAWLYGCESLVSYTVPAGMRLQNICKPSNTTANSSSSVNATTDYTNATTDSINATTDLSYLYPDTGCPACMCDQPYNVTYNISLEEKLQELINALKIQKKSLSSFKRTKISAPDKRVSSAAIGSVLGIGVLSVITLIIVLPDVPILGFHLFRFQFSTLSGKINATV